jgi:hypothetical protein
MNPKTNNNGIALGAAIVFYDDNKSLTRTLLSIADNVHTIIAIDGVYSTYPDKSNNGLSQDGSREVCMAFSNVALYDMPFCSEVQKRNHTLELAKEHDLDFLLIIDSDEYIAKEWADWDKFYKDLNEVVIRRHRMTYNMFNMRLYDEGAWIDKPRLLYKPWELEYYYNHHTFRRRPEYWVNTSPVAPVDMIEGVRITHDPYLRTDKHLDARKKYHDWIMNGGEGLHQ